MTYMLLIDGTPRVELVPDNTSLPVTDADAFNLAVWEIIQHPQWQDRGAQVWKCHTDGMIRGVCRKAAHGPWEAA